MEISAMTAPRIVDPAAVLGQALADASPDLMRHLLATTINALLSAEADAVCGAEWGQPGPERVNRRNGYRHRDLDTRVGTIDVAVPKLRTGTYFPEWLIERRKRAESALISDRHAVSRSAEVGRHRHRHLERRTPPQSRCVMTRGGPSINWLRTSLGCPDC
jgi:hypothetical protein